MTIQKIYIGGWFQRTTLHLTEIWDFLKHGKSNLDFPKEKLAEARNALSVDRVSRESGPLEYILNSRRCWTPMSTLNIFGE